MTRRRDRRPPPPDERGGKLQIKVPILPPFISYDLELRPDSFLAKLWKRSPLLARAGLILGLLVVVGGIGLGGWKLVQKALSQASSRGVATSSGSATPLVEPELYAVRVVVLGQEGQPVEGSKLRVSTGSEPQRVAGGWEVEIPRLKVPANGSVTFWAEHPASSARGSKEVPLGVDPTPSVTISLTVPEATIRGTVLDTEGRTLAGALVSVLGHGEAATVTGPRGSFELPAHRPPGEQVRIHVEHPDYSPRDQYCWAGGTGCEIRLTRR